MAATALTGALAGPAQAGVVGDGRNLEVAPAIDFVLAEGWPEGSTLRVEVLRGATVVAQKTGQVDGEGTDTTFEVNHVGGADCWEGTGGTPDIKPGDKIQVTDVGNPADVNWTYARDISFTEDANGLLTGTARGAEEAGGGFDLAAPIDMEGATMEARRVGAQRFSAAISPDPTTGNWTAQLGGTPGSGEVSVDWFVGGDAGAGGGQETTSGFPVGEVGEQPCGPRQATALTHVSHAAISSVNQGTDLVVGGPEAGVEDTIASVAFAGKSYPVERDAETQTWRAVVPAADLTALPQGMHQLTVTHAPSGTETRSIQKDTIAPVISASPGSGTYTGPQGVVLTSDGGEAVRYTLDGLPASGTSTQYSGTPISLGTGTHQVRTRAVDAVGNVGVADFDYVIKEQPASTGGTGTDPKGGTPATGDQKGGTTTSTGSSGGSGGTTSAGPALVASPVIASNTALPRLAVKALTVPKRISAAAARRNGLALTLRLPAGTKALKVTVSRVTGKRSRKLATSSRTLRGGGLHRVRLSQKALRRSLRPGRYVVDVAAGRSAAELGKATRATVTVVR